MRIIITGGTGLIGTALARRLAAANDDIIILSRNPDKATGLPAGVKTVKWDGRTAQGWGHLADGAKAIINLAGASIAGDGFIPSRWTEKRKKLIMDSRVQAGQAVVEAVNAAATKPELVVQSSAVGYYGPHGDETLSEATGPGNDFLAQVCQAWERSTQPVVQQGVRLVVIRTGVVLSTQGGAFPLLLLPHKLFAGGPMGSGKQWLPWIHLEDEVRAIQFLIENSQAQGVFNVCAPEPVTNRQMSQAIGQAISRPSFLPVPGFALKLLLGEAASLVLDGQRQIPQRLTQSGFPFSHPDLLPAIRHLVQNNI
jgi:uncharacterized protein (TIGR01777 family)